MRSRAHRPPQRATTVVATAITTVAAALALAACDSPVDDGDHLDRELEVADDEVAATPTPSAVNGSGDDDVPRAGDPPSLAGLLSEDELEVARTMQEYYGWLLRHPDTSPELVGEIFREAEEGSPDRYTREYTRIEQYRAEPQWWWAGGDGEVVAVDVVDELPNVRVVRVYYHRTEPMQLVDAEGRVHEERPAERVWGEEVWMRDDSSSPWKVLSWGDHGQWAEGDL